MNETTLTQIKVYPTIIIVIILFFFTGHGVQYLCAFFSISIHEALHICCGKFYNLKIQTIKIFPAGLNAEIDETSASFKQKIVMYLCGPLANIMLFVIAIILYKNLGSLFYAESINKILILLYQINAYLVVFNLLPIFPLDGGKILFEIISNRKGLQTAQKFINKVSLNFLVVLLLIGIIQTYLFFNFNILIISIYLVFLTKNTRWEVAFMNLKQLLFRRSRILKKGVYPARCLVVKDNVSLGEVLKNMDFDGFHMVYVLDDMLKITDMVTEQDIINGLIDYDNEITLREYIKKNM